MRPPRVRFMAGWGREKEVVWLGVGRGWELLPVRVGEGLGEVLEE